MLPENNLGKVFLILFIVFVIFFLLGYYKPKNKEKLTNTRVMSPHDSILKACPYKDDDFSVSPGYTPVTPTDKYNNTNPKINVKSFNNDFFQFRDFTEQNSSMRYDSVDKIQDMTLNGELEKMNLGGSKIRDIYDALASNDVNLYKKPCVRLPFFDDINPDGYSYQPGTPGMHLVPDDWKYKNEKVINGGNFMTNIVGNDPNNTDLFDLSRFPKTE